MKYLIALVFTCTSILVNAQIFGASNFTLISRLDPETGTNGDGDKYSACWGWFQSAKNKEYAIACSQGGTYWVDMTNPATPSVSAYNAATRTAATWREAKTYQNYCYVISDDGGNNSFQIFDMQYLPDSVHKVYDDKTIFKRGHTLWVDGNKLYVASVTYSNSTFESMNVYSLATPTAPVLLRSLSQDYPFINGVHDMFVRKDTVYASCEYQGLYVFKLTATNTFTQLGSLSTYTAAGYNHSSALTPDGKTLVFTDEVPNGLPIKVANVSNLQNIQVVATTNQYSLTTPHNPFIVNNSLCFMSSYEEGIQLYNISNPATPSLVAWYDTYPQGGGNTGSWSNAYGGQWGCYPFQPSRTIFALDQFNGLFFLKTAAYSKTVSTVGIDESGLHSAEIFPNPAVNHLFIYGYETAQNNMHLVLSDLSGRVVFDANLPLEARSGTSVDIANVTSGLYLVNLYRDGASISTKKLVISR
jgi:choice-of-anchor B domain-containing protein